MDTRKGNARRAQEENVNDEVPPQAPQDPQAPNDEEVMTNVEIRAAFQTLTQLITVQAQTVTTQAQIMVAQSNQEVRPRVEPNVSTMASRLRDFTRMNPPIFLGSKVNEDPQECLEEVYKIVDAMRVTSIEKAELAGY
uniref:Gag-pol polyprotein n=1 Tax=Solanum tuberosum TaxID=4113 RepID=M1DPA3_SOLTU